MYVSAICCCWQHFHISLMFSNVLSKHFLTSPSFLLITTQSAYFQTKLSSQFSHLACTRAVVVQWRRPDARHPTYNVHSLVSALSFTPARPKAQRLIIYHNSFISCLMAGSIHTYAHTQSVLARQTAGQQTGSVFFACARPTFFLNTAPAAVRVCAWVRARRQRSLLHTPPLVDCCLCCLLASCLLLTFSFFNNMTYKIFVFQE